METNTDHDDRYTDAHEWDYEHDGYASSRPLLLDEGFHCTHTNRAADEHRLERGVS